MECFRGAHLDCAVTSDRARPRAQQRDYAKVLEIRILLKFITLLWPRTATVLTVLSRCARFRRHELKTLGQRSPSRYSPPPV